MSESLLLYCFYITSTDWFDRFTPATTGFSRSVLKTNATKLVSAWLEGSPKKKDLSDCAFMGDKILAKLFIRYNRAIYSFCYIQNVTVIVTEK
jgi:hypothetical protein